MKETGIKPIVLEEIRSLAKKYQVEKIILFGSRARGDFHQKSDIDIAVKGGDFVPFALEIDENTSTLLEYDIINLNDRVSEELMESIDREGITIYEKI